MRSVNYYFCNRFNTQPPEGGWKPIYCSKIIYHVSTHSRLKAAGFSRRDLRQMPVGFNTQPPEGGWPAFAKRKDRLSYVSTHSRLKAAGQSGVKPYQ